MKRIMAALSALMCFASAALAESFINLTTIKNDIVVTDGTRLHAVLDNDGKISIAPNATITLWMAIIQQSATKQGAGITCLGDATIILESENYICGRSSGFPAIYVPKGSTLTIKGTGRLTAIGNGFAAGIGGGDGQNCGNIVVDGGIITAKGGSSSNDGTITYITDDMIIPPGSNYKQNSIIIHPPTVNGGGPGIGAARDATCGKIVFSHGIVEAWASDGYPAIGAKDSKSKCPSVTFKQTIGKVSAVVKGISDDDIISAKNVYYGVVAGVPSGYAGTNTKKTEEGYPGGNKKIIGWSSYRTLTVASQLGSLGKHKIISDYYEVGNTIEWRRTVLRGELSGDYEITLADGAEVVFDGVTVAGALKTEMPGITCWGDAIIILKGENYIKGNGDCYPGIFVPEGHTLKFQGDGSLTVVGGGSYATAIGGVAKSDSSKKSGTIRVISGEITAIGGEFASALGGTFEESGRQVEYGDGVEFYGGSVHARGGIPLDDLNSTYLSDGVKVTSEGDEEFFRWNGRLDKVPDALTDVADEVYIVAHDATTIRGKLPDPPRDDYWGFVYDREIRIADGARVTLQDAVISRPKSGGSERSMEEGNVFSREKKGQWSDYFIKETNTPRYHSGIRCMGDAEITIKGDNSIAGTDFRAGISVADGKKLTLKGEGSLSAYGGKEGGGIDGGSKVVIEGGVINAYGGDGGSGIGASRIEFNGGSTTAVAYETGASSPNELADICAIGYSASSTIVVGEKLKRETEEVSGYNSSGHFKNCTEKISFDGNLDGLDDDGEEEESGGTKKKMMLASAAPRLLGSGIDLSNLDEISSEAIAGDGTVITGTLSGRHKVSIAHNATVTLRNATISPTSSSDSSLYAGLTCLGNATIVLEGENIIGSFNEHFPGVQVPAGRTLTIEGAGSLEVVGGTSGGAGIGGIREQASGNVVINGGDVTATGGYGAAGVGGAFTASCGTIRINGGNVIATGGAYAPGVGGGMYGSCAAVYVESGIGKVVATKGENSPDYIGRGYEGSIDRIDISGILGYTVSGKTRTYKWDGDIGKIYTQSGGEVITLTAYEGTVINGSTYSTSTSSDKACRIQIAPGAHVTLNNATINKTRAKNGTRPWAGITCLGNATITLLNTSEVSSFHADYPGIYVPQGCKLTIEGAGTLTANNATATGGAGIGGGSAEECLGCGKIVINGGDVTAYGGTMAAGIGGGNNGLCDGVLIGAGIAHVKAVCGDEGNASALGYGNNGECGTIQVAKGVKESYGTYYREFIPDPDTDLSKLTGSGEKVIETGAIVTGTLAVNRKISLAAGAEVTLNNVVIPGNNDSSCEWAGINCLGNATIWLEGTSIVRGSYRRPGIHVPSGCTLTIKGKNENGELNAYAFDYAAGIGGGWELSCGNIVIDGGTIYAEGGAQCAGIGAGTSHSSCAGITINGGIVTAKGGSNGGSGIGAGSVNSSCANITINSGITYVEAVRGSSSTYPISASTVTVVSGLSDNTLDGGSRRVIFPNVVLGSLTGGGDVVVARNNSTISGTLGANRKIVIAAGATVTLDNVTINGVNNSNYAWAGITCLGDATIILVGENAVKGFYEDYPGIYVPRNRTLTIKGNGSLVASSNGFGAGIGGGWEMPCGSIVIEDGTITATGGATAAAIGGGGREANGGNADCGDITISGGFVTATGGRNAAGIGAGYNANCGKITIAGDTKRVVATGGPEWQGYGAGAPIGLGGKGGSCASITFGATMAVVTDGLTSTVMNKSMNLGWLSSDFTLQDGMTVAGTLQGNYKVSIAPGAHITLNQATIEGENDDEYPWAGLTCLGDATITLRNSSKIRGFYEDYPGIYVPEDCTLTIDGRGTLVARNNDYAAGIGGGYHIPCGNIVIGGTPTVSAYGGKYYGAGIGGGNAACGDITINGGNITASGGIFAAGIGGGDDSACGRITIGAGITRVTATRGNEQPGSDYVGEPIGKGASRSDGASCAGVVIAEDIDDTIDGATRTLIGFSDVDLSKATGKVTLGTGSRVTGQLPGNYQVEVAAGAKIWLKDVRIAPFVDPSNTHVWPGIKCLGDATIVLEGENTVMGFSFSSGIYIKKGKTLTIKGDGSLYVNGGYCSAAIGGCYYRDGVDNEDKCGNIVIEGGVIDATRTTWYSDYSPAIGGSACTSDGSEYNSSRGQGCGDITIRGGVITVHGSNESSAIGAGCGMSCGNITIEPGVKKLVVQWDYLKVADPIGKGGDFSGHNSSCGTVTLNGIEDYEEKVIDVSNSGIASDKMMQRTYYQDWDGDLSTLKRDITIRHNMAIFGSTDAEYDITINDGVAVKLCDASITRFKKAGLTCNGDVTLVLAGNNAIEVTKNDTSSSDQTMPAIRVPFGSSVTIDGNGSLVAKNASRSSAPAIGEKPYEPSGGGSIYIIGGSVTAYGGEASAAIGASDYRDSNEYTRLEIGPDVVKVVAAAPAGPFWNGQAYVEFKHSDLIGPESGCRPASQGGGFSIDSSLSVVGSETEMPYYDTTATYLVRTVAPDGDVCINAAIQEWATESGASIGGAWNATDVATGVANAFRYIFDLPGQEIAKSDILDIVMEDGFVVILTPEVVNGGNFKLWVVASDDPGGTENVFKYPLSSDGVTAIDEINKTTRFFKLVAEIAD